MTTAFTALISAALAQAAQAAGSKLLETRVADSQHLMLFLKDGEIVYKDDGQGKGAFGGHESQGGEVAVKYGTLDVAAAARPENFVISSADDPAYGPAGKPVAAVYRKTKCNGNVAKWPDPDTWTVEHTLFLKLPSPLMEGKTYTVAIAPAVGADTASSNLTFSSAASWTEALHVNLLGYHPDKPKTADLYLWMGDGGARDFSAFEGKPVRLVDSKTGRAVQVGTVKAWKKAGGDYGGHNLTASDVWTVDFSNFKTEGTYRLSVDGVGASPEFVISREAYAQPYKTSVRGFYYMRIGEPKDAAHPPPRQPRLIQGEDPKELKIFLTTMSPWHPEWKSLPGDAWDVVDWSKWKEPGEPTNPNAYGGHSDACDWDRHIGHISIVWDMLLPYVLTNGKLAEDDCQIRESGNGVPDIIDEAQNEVDFWLRLRDTKGGYSAGLNNPPGNGHNTLYQAAAKPYCAWASAANAAMLAEAYRIAGKPELVKKYVDAAVEAWNTANGEDLDLSFGIGNGKTRGRDLKMIAAAYLYNATGDRKWEDEMAKEAVVTSPTSEIDNKDSHCQYWGVAAYLMADKYKIRPIHHPQLLANMKASVADNARKKNLEPMKQRPSRRSADGTYGWFQSTQDVHAAVISHAIAPAGAEKDALLLALVAEADYGLGRNPMNMTQMTGLGSRHPTDIYTSGKNDGVPGVHPGHTPYMNARAWGKGWMADPQWYASRGYPEWAKWPHGEALWQARYCFSNNEFTPQQSMRGKMVLLGYLYGIR
jgi:hypothetical protein